MQTAIFFVTMCTIFSDHVIGQISVGDLNSCPPHLNRGGNLVEYNRKCYDVVTYQHLSWQDSKEECSRGSGRLVEIGDANTNEFLRQYMSTLDNVGDGVWIGLDDQDSEGTWRWDSGAQVTFTRWGSDQPGAGLWGFVNDCAVMKTADGRWYDYPCDVFYEHFSYICQYDAL